MKLFILLALALLAGPALAQDSALLKGDALQAEAEKNCAGGCILFNAQEIEAFQALLDAAIQAREQAAYQMGLQQGATACRDKGRGA